MTFRKNILLILLAVAQSNLYSQADSTIKSFESQHMITFSSGVGLNSVRDEIISPLIYRGSKIPLVISYRYRGLSNRHTVLFHYDNNDLTSSITNSSASSHFVKNQYLNLEYSYAFNVAEIKNYNTVLFLGAKFSSLLNMRNHYFEQDKSHISAEQITGLGIYFLTETRLQKESNNYLSAEINIPFISYALLTDRYNANVSEKFDDLNPEENTLWQLFKRGDIISFNKLFEIQADISYNIIITNSIGLGLYYRFQYYSFEQFHSLFHSKVMNNQFLIGLMVKL